MTGNSADGIGGVPMVAVIVARDACLPAGADEATAEAGGCALVVGSGTRDAAGKLGAASRVWLHERPSVGPAALAEDLVPVLVPVDVVLLPASPDGRDLAPRLAAALNRPLLANAVRCAVQEVELTRLDDRVSLRVAVDGPAVVTLRPGVRGAPTAIARPEVIELPLAASSSRRDADSIEVLPPGPATTDLTEARRILAGGAGLVPTGADGKAVMRLLAEVAAKLGASTGATRVVTDAGWTDCDRQIGTTGVTVDPELYVAFGIAGAAQHVGGLGAPAHVVSVNTDPSCPMTAMADLGIVADAPAVLAELAARLGVPGAEAAVAREERHGWKTDRG